MNIDEIFSRHSRIAFQLSGGKDSVALLLTMMPYWDRMTVYHLDTGDTHPETAALVDAFASLVDHFVRVKGDVFAVKKQHGIPADVVPWSSSAIAHECNVGKTELMQDRVSCCARTVMIPLHQRMISDGITLIIRGQKSCDDLRGPLSSGDVVDGIEFLYPFQDKSDEDCFAIMRAHGVRVPSYYAENLSGDCLGCTAWHDGGNRAAHIRKNYPKRFDRYRAEILSIHNAVNVAASGIDKEVSEVANSMVAASDRRLKKKISRVGEDKRGFGIYEFEYRDNPGSRFRGVMADEVEPIVPEAVSYGEDGFARVDYERLGLKMVEV